MSGAELITGSCLMAWSLNRESWRRARTNPRAPCPGLTSRVLSCSPDEALTCRVRSSKSKERVHFPPCRREGSHKSGIRPLGSQPGVEKPVTLTVPVLRPGSSSLAWPSVNLASSCFLVSCYPGSPPPTFFQLVQSTLR